MLIVDRPSVVNDLKCAEVEKDAVTLVWNAPSNTGGIPLSGYAIEKCDTSRSTWTSAGTASADKTTFLVTRLFEGTEYKFRVAAENSVGTGDFVELDKPVTAKLPFGMRLKI